MDKESLHHQDLSQVIKETHAILREKIQQDDNNQHLEDKIWCEHAQEVMSSIQKPYATAMETLAKQIWDQKNANNSESRVDWIKHHINKYFIQKDFVRFHERLNRKLSHLEEQDDPSSERPQTGANLQTSFLGKVSILDIGSCYNPLADISDYDVTAIDLSPSPDGRQVYQCDFVTVSVEDKAGDESTRFSIDTTPGQENVVTKLYSDSFDCVVFSLLLEYLPVPRLRYNVCQKVFKLLKSEGLFIIITPDSSHQGKNLNQIRSWQVALANIGFVRIYIEKLKHLRCLAFVKIDHTHNAICRDEIKTLSQKLGQNSKQKLLDDPSSFMFIPQDLTTKKNLQKKSKSKPIENQSDIDEQVLEEFLSGFSDV